MPCYSPRSILHEKTVVSGFVYKNGKRIPFLARRKFSQVVPCGKCLGCLRVRQMQYAFRAEWESLDPSTKAMYFVTLTFAPEYFEDNELFKKDCQDYICRLRHRNPDIRIRYMICGEHGELYDRKHYHCLLFCTGELPYSDIVGCWNRGIVDIRPASLERFGYVAKYSVKQLGDNSSRWLQEPFILVSNGLGFYFLEKHGDFCRKNFVNAWLNGSGYPVKLPRVFMERLFPPRDKVHTAKVYGSNAASSYYSAFVGNKQVLKECLRLAYDAKLNLSATKAGNSVSVHADMLNVRNSVKGYFLSNSVMSRVHYETGRY